MVLIAAQLPAQELYQQLGQAGWWRYGAPTNGDVQERGTPRATFLERIRFERRFAVSSSPTLSLAPGSRAETTLELPAGSLLMAGADSKVFDPRLTVIGPDGKVLAQNEDRSSDDPAPYVQFETVQGGTYRFQVDCQFPLAGGEVTLRTKRWDVHSAVRNGKHFRLPKVPHEKLAQALYRFDLRAGEVVMFHDILGSVGTNDLETMSGYWIGPRGVQGTDFTMLSVVNRNALLARRSGPFYRIASYPEQPPVAQLVAVREVPPAQSEDVVLDAGEAVIYRMPVKPQEVYRMFATMPSGTTSVLIDDEPQDYRSIEYSQDMAARYGHLSFRLDQTNSSHVVRVISRPGDLMVSVRNLDKVRRRMTVQLNLPVPEWAAGTPQKEFIRFGNSVIWTLRGPVQRLERWRVTADTIVPTLDVFTADTAYERNLGRQPRASWEQFFGDDRLRIIRLAALDHAGAGHITAERQVLVPQPIALGQAVRLPEEDQGIGYFVVTMPSGKPFGVSPTPYAEVFVLDVADRPLSPGTAPILGLPLVAPESGRVRLVTTQRGRSPVPETLTVTLEPRGGSR